MNNVFSKHSYYHAWMHTDLHSTVQHNVDRGGKWTTNEHRGEERHRYVNVTQLKNNTEFRNRSYKCLNFGTVVV
jgi:hypothetical protein